MKIISIIKLAFKNIVSNKLRSILTMLGLIIGIASVIVLVGIGNGSNTEVQNQVQSLGTDVLMANITSETESLKYEKIAEIENLENILKVTPYKMLNYTLNRGNKTANRSMIMATNSNYLDIVNIKLSSGRKISEIDIENKSKICLIGSEVVPTLFGFTDPIGETVKINGDNYVVVGVLEEKGSVMGIDMDNIVLIPISSAKHFGEDTTINNLYIQVDNEKNIDFGIMLVKNYIRSALQISSDEYSVTSQTSTLDAMNSITDTLTLLLVGIASISLIVGGIGVMNVMLISVSERTKEIGIRKSLGAKKRDILIQFLIEALILSVLGGILGILIGVLIGNVLDKFGYSFVNTELVIIVSFTSSVIIGLVFGIFPAYRAAKLNPIDALHNE